MGGENSRSEAGRGGGKWTKGNEGSCSTYSVRPSRGRLWKLREKKAGVCLDLWVNTSVKRGGWPGHSLLKPGGGCLKSHRVHLPSLCCLEYCSKHGMGATSQCLLGLFRAHLKKPRRPLYQPGQRSQGCGILEPREGLSHFLSPSS